MLFSGDHSAAQADVCSKPAAAQPQCRRPDWGRAVCSSPSWRFPGLKEGWRHAAGCEQVAASHIFVMDRGFADSPAAPALLQTALLP